MPDQWRLGLVERSVLEALDRGGARPDRQHRKSANTVGVLEKEFGVSPRYGYDALCMMAQPWRVHVRLVDFHGNYGSANESDPPANPRYTEARLSRAGWLALAAERGDGPPLPIRLINGDLHLDGFAPPFSPRRVIAALLALLDDPRLPDEEIVERGGPPESPTGCGIVCDSAALAAGEQTPIVMSAHISHEVSRSEPAFVLSHLPLGVGEDTVIDAIAARVKQRRGAPGTDEFDDLVLDLRDVRNESVDPITRIVCVLRDDAVPSLVEPQLASTWGVRIRREVGLAAPLAPLVRELVQGDPAAQRTALAALSATL